METPLLEPIEDVVPAEESGSSTHGPALHVDALTEGVAIVLVLTIVQRFIGFGRTMLFCRWLDPAELGLWDMAWSFLLLAAPLAVLSLPGTFGRYAEHFRSRGQLRIFLRATALFCGVTVVLAASGLWLLRPWFAKLIFDTSTQAPLVAVLAFSLLAVVAYNYVTSLFTSLRHVRWVAGLELLNSLAFAAGGITLLAAWRCSAGSVVLAYGLSCGLCCAVAAVAVARVWRSAPPSAEAMHTAVWRKLLPFSAWILGINMLTNLFALADRAMIVHFAPGSTEQKLAMVGQYHSARVVPLLMVTVAGLLAGILLPHLSHDWEAGRRDHVSRRLNLALKLLLFAMFAAGVALLWIAPWLFDQALAGKYAAGRAVLGQTLVYCVWFGATMIAQQYLWCAERAGRVCLALAAGLAANVGLNFVLLPQWGLAGAVASAAVANLLTLLLLVALSRSLGWKLDLGAWLGCALPLALLGGPLLGALALLLAAAAAWRSGWLLSAWEKERLRSIAARAMARLRRRGSPPDDDTMTLSP